MQKIYIASQTTKCTQRPRPIAPMAVCQMQQAWGLIGIWWRENKHEVEWASSINLAPDRFACYSRYTILQMAATPSTIFSFLLVAAVIQDVPGLVSQIGFHIFSARMFHGLCFFSIWKYWPLPIMRVYDTWLQKACFVESPTIAQRMADEGLCI